MLLRLSRIDILVLDDFAMLTSQVPLAHWHEQISDPTLADSILDRLVHNAYRLKLSSESMRKKRNRKPEEES